MAPPHVKRDHHAVKQHWKVRPGRNHLPDGGPLLLGESAPRAPHPREHETRHRAAGQRAAADSVVAHRHAQAQETDPARPSTGCEGVRYYGEHAGNANRLAFQSNFSSPRHQQLFCVCDCDPRQAHELTSYLACVLSLNQFIKESRRWDVQKVDN